MEGPEVNEQGGHSGRWVRAALGAVPIPVREAGGSVRPGFGGSCENEGERWDAGWASH